MVLHWVNLRCAGIRQVQYTYTWTWHLHRESRIAPHTDITPPQSPDPGPSPYLHHPPNRNQNASNTVPTGLVKSKPNPLIHAPPLHPCRPETNTYTSHILHQLLTSQTPPSSITRQLC